MKNNKKTIIITSIILGVLILTISLTYAVFSMSKTGQNSSLVVGDVYMHYANGSKSINLVNAMPNETYDATSFFEFTIDGKNTTTNKDIWYEIILKHGDDITGKTRIKDNLLKFTLTETKNGTTTTVFDGRSYGDLTNKRIWVNTINKNTTNEVSITYRLYMWISNTTVIGNVDQDYTMEEWKNVFASIKVDVAGDFNEKYIETDASCFETYESDYYIPNPIMKTQEYTKGGSNELSKCVDYYLGYGETFDEGTTAETYCKGEGTRDGRKIEFEGVDGGHSEFINNNVFLVKNALVISDYDTNCGSDVVIPKTTNSKRIFEIGLHAFESNQLTSVIFPETLIKIDYLAFKYNDITAVKIPDSVIYLSCGAFDNNVSITKNSNLKCAVVYL